MDFNKPISNLQARLYDCAAAVHEENAKDADAINFMARSMVLATLPHSDPGDIPSWGRKNGNYSFTIEPGYFIDDNNVPQSYGIPYGSKPRLILCWLTSEAVRTKSREIDIGRTLASFCRELKLGSTGGDNGSITSLKKQIIKLFSSRISCTYNTPNEVSRISMSIADKSFFWWSSAAPNNIAKWESTITLGEEFFKEIISHPIPVDFRIINSLRQSPLAMDVYVWLTYRFSYLTKTTIIPWDALEGQFGCNYSEKRFFRRKFNDAIRKVLTVYRDAKVTDHKNGLLLYPSKTSVQMFYIPK